MPPPIGLGFFPVIAPVYVFVPTNGQPAWPPPAVSRAPLISVPPREFEVGNSKTTGQGGKLKEPMRSAQLVVIGDRLLRSNNVKRAEERYLQASRLDPSSSGPRIRLAQVAFIRGNYDEAADRLREAQAVQPSWLETPFDIQSIYGEPGDFAQRIATLESHVNAYPDDRNAWLVLGAQWYLTGRIAKSTDIFNRLDDPARRPEDLLTAFLNILNRRRGPSLPPDPGEAPGGR